MMRVTTQMLNNTASKSGIMLTGRSLLDYVNGDDNSMGNGLLNALNKGSNVIDTAKKNSYEKLGKEADSLSQKAELFLKDKDTLFDKARESGDNQEIYDAIEDLVKSYNNTIAGLQSSSSALDGYYAEMLKEATAENKEALEKIGITIGKDGKMNVDKEKLQASDVDSLEKAFGSSNVFATKVAFISFKISSNAAANVASFSNQYNSYGDLYSAMSGKYDFWGQHIQYQINSQKRTTYIKALKRKPENESFSASLFFYDMPLKEQKRIKNFIYKDFLKPAVNSNLQSYYSHTMSLT